MTKYGLFECTVLPLGLCNAPSTFQRLMNSVMGEYIDDFVLVYLDDILVFSSTEHEHENHLRLVFQRLRQHKLYAKLNKCEFGKPRVNVVGSGKVHVDKDKVAAVTNWEPPRDIKGVEQFLGFAKFYNRFIPDFAKVAAPISNLLSNHKKFKWGTEQQCTFDTLKQLLTSAPMLKLPDYSKPFRIDLAADASDVAVGAELSQNEQPVAFYSKKLTPTEARYHITDHELLAIYQACIKWRQYLHRHRCTVCTEHKLLTYLYTQPHLCSRQARWLDHLAKLDLQIVYCPGALSTIADVLLHYGQCIEGESSVVASHSFKDERVQQFLKTWLSVVAPHVDY